MRYIALGLIAAAAVTLTVRAHADNLNIIPGISPDGASAGVHAWRDPCWPLNHPAVRGIDCSAQGYPATYPALNTEPYDYATEWTGRIVRNFGSIFDDAEPYPASGRGSHSEDFTYFPGSGGYGVSKPFRRDYPDQTADVWVESKDGVRRRLATR